MSSRLTPYTRFLRRLFTNLPKRALLTLRYQGRREFLFRLVTFPLRLTPLGPRLGLVERMSDPTADARAWYRREGRAVTIVIPSYGPPDLALQAVRSIKRTARGGDVHIVVADDGSGPEHVAALRAEPGIAVVAGEEQRGFAANVNRGLRARRPGDDVVLLNSDIIALPGWLETLQHAAYVSGGDDVGITGGKLLYPDGTIQFAGTIRNPGAPEWFDHRFRFKPADFPAANVMQPALGVTGACLYITAETLQEVGELDEAYGMAYEDVDWCLKAWESGRQVVYVPAAELTHLESKTRGMDQGERELAAQRYFWQKWGSWFDERNVRSDDGEGYKIVYVTQDVGVGGGHRVVFQHLEGLAARGHQCELWTLGKHPPDWWDLKVPMRSFPDYATLAAALDPLEAFKVATWWETAPPVWLASVRRGIPVFFVQDIETSYYPDDPHVHGEIHAVYRPEFNFLTTSGWVREQLLQWAPDTAVVSPGLDTELFHPLEGVRRHDRALLALGRSNPLKNFPLTREAYLAMQIPRPELWLFGVEPDLGREIGARYVIKPSDEEVNRLLNQATAFVQTSRHEGFCLPVLEAMAAGAPSICTDAHGNRDYCVDGENCLMPEAEPRAVARAIEAVLGNDDLRAKIVANGFKTAEAYAWERKLDELDAFYRDLAGRGARVDLTGAVAG